MRARKILAGARRKPVKKRVIESACGKKGYVSRKDAAAAAASARSRTGDRILAYRCPHGCHAWHIGHPPARIANPEPTT